MKEILILFVYANAATTSDELIISYDEMTGAGTSKDCPRFTDVSGKAAGYEGEYKRQDSNAYIGLNVATGQNIGACRGNTPGTQRI